MSNQFSLVFNKPIQRTKTASISPLPITRQLFTTNSTTNSLQSRQLTSIKSITNVPRTGCCSCGR